MNERPPQPAILALRALGDRIEALEVDRTSRSNLVPSTAKGRIAMALACAIPACAAVIAVTNGGSTPDSPLPRPVTAPAQTSPAGPASEVFLYDDLAQMQATSDLVVRGTVVAIEPGRTVGGPEGKDGPAAVDEYTNEPTGAIQLNEVVVRVDEWLGGTSTIGPGSEIVLEEEAPVAALAASSQIGDSGVYFVMEMDDGSGASRLSGSPARFLQTEDPETLLSSNPEIDWAAKAADRSLEELEALIREIQDDVEQGKIKPARSPFG